MVNNGQAPLGFIGIITEIENDFLCMNCGYSLIANIPDIKEPTDICITIGQIAELIWPKL